MANAYPTHADNQTAPDAETPVRFEDLLVRVGTAKDRDAFIRLFEHFAPRLKSFLIKGGLDAGTADEIAQETMLTVWDKAAGYDPKIAAASTWIFTIARNKRSDMLRKAVRPEPLPEDLLFDETLRQDNALALSEEAQALSEAIKNLPPEQAELIQKAFFEEKTHKDIAAETKLPLGTVKSRIRLALEKMRGVIAPDMKDS